MWPRTSRNTSEPGSSTSRTLSAARRGGIRQMDGPGTRHARPTHRSAPARRREANPAAYGTSGGEPVQGALEVLGVGALERHVVAAARVLEAEPDGVQPLPVETQA